MPLGASPGIFTFVGFPWIGSWNWFPPRYRPCGRRWPRKLTDAHLPAHMDAVGAPDPPLQPQLMGKVIRNGRFPDNLVGFFWSIPSQQRGGGELSSELRSRQVIHTFLRHLASRVDPATGTDVGKTMAGYTHGRPLPVIPRIRSRLPQGLPLNVVPGGGVPSLQVEEWQASNTSKANQLIQMYKTR